MNGSPLPRLRSRKGYWLLALLALRQGREVERTWLAGTLWPDAPESVALANLRTTLKDLRRALGGQTVCLRSASSHTLLLGVEDAEADVVAFSRAVARGNPASLQEAVALYRGPLLEGWAEEWLVEGRRAYEEAYLHALVQLAAAATALGRHGEAASSLRRVIATDPLREGAHRSLMEALAAGGEYAAATQVYRDLRVLLHREVNAEPVPESRACYEQIRDQARRAAANVRRPIPGGPPSDPAHNLPAQLTRFIGRQREIAAIKALLGTNRLVTLTGSGGCGKTRLALEFAAGIVGEFPDGVWLVELAALADPALVTQSVATALGVIEQPGQSLLDTLAGSLHDRSLLLIVDNCEHLVFACARFGDDLLRACPNLRILATSREALGIAGEQTYRVPSLSLPDPRQWSMVNGQCSMGAGQSVGHQPSTIDHQPSSLLVYEAVRLFIDRTILSQSTFALTPQNAPSVVEICRRLDGIPLAIELAAARVKALPVEQIAARMGHLVRLLTGGSRTALPRQQTLRAIIDWSYDLLSDAERALLRRLSVFVGGWTLEAAEAVCAFGATVEDLGLRVETGGSPSTLEPQSSPLPLEAWRVLDLLASLIDKSLVLYWEEGDRYRLLETVRQYALDRLREAGEAEAARSRHRDWYLDLAERAEPELAREHQREWMERLEAEHDNLRTALDTCLTEPECSAEEPVSRVTAGLRLAAALGRFWTVRGHMTEGRGTLARLLERAARLAERLPASPSGVPASEPAARLSFARAQALRVAGLVAAGQAYYPAARGFFDEALTLLRKLGDKRAIADLITAPFTDLFSRGPVIIGQAALRKGLSPTHNCRP